MRGVTQPITKLGKRPTASRHGQPLHKCGHTNAGTTDVTATKRHSTEGRERQEEKRGRGEVQAVKRERELEGEEEVHERG